jgi:L-lactate utilization protein LutC
MNEGNVEAYTVASRRRFIDAVRRATGRSAGDIPPAPEIDEALVRLVEPDEDLIECFSQRAVEVGMAVHRQNAANADDAIVSLLGQINARTAVIGMSDAAQMNRLQILLKANGIDVLDFKAPGAVDRQFDVDVGITDVHAALADTGSLVCCSDASHGRCLSLVPPVHVAVVHRRRILADMVDLWSAVRDGTMLPGSISIITGPSKTADIEGELITGVHGPGREEIFIVDDG